MPDRFIKLRSGLLEKKHRDEMGARIWLYLYMLDTADWEKGTIFGWTDKGAATDMEMPHRTVQEQRQILVKAGYITCQQGLHGLDVIIHNYVNPREATTENPVPYPTSKSSTLPIISDFNNNITMPVKTLYALRRHFSEKTSIPQPAWSNMSKASRGKYGGWWNNPLKNMWLATEQDEERTKEVITTTLQQADWKVYAPISIEKAFYKYINTKDDNRGFERA